MRFFMAFLAGIAASAASAQAPDRVAILVAAIEDAGCVVHEDNEAEVLESTGMTAAEASAIVKMLMSTGQAVPQDDDLRLVIGKCN